MDQIKESFIQLAIDCNVLKFGEFTLKSGRVSPYFFNAGLFYHGMALRQVGQFYAKTILDNTLEFEHLFGPAYKGLPLTTTTAVALAEMGINSTVTFNRKEIKQHGEGGQLIGSPLTGKTIIIDDVITAGTAFREAQQLISQHGGHLTAVIIALDRCERGLSNHSTLSEIEKQGIQVYSIITLMDLMEYLKMRHEEDHVEKLEKYHAHYGC